MAMVTPQQAAARWKQNFAASGQKLMDGVNAVTINPMEQAANRGDAMLAGIQASVMSGKWAASLRGTSLQGWKDSMKNKTVPRLQSGAASGESKMANFMTQWLPYEQGVVSALPPRGSTQENIQRAVQVMTQNAQFKYVRQGG